VARFKLINRIPVLITQNPVYFASQFKREYSHFCAHATDYWQVGTLTMAQQSGAIKQAQIDSHFEEGLQFATNH